MLSSYTICRNRANCYVSGTFCRDVLFVGLFTCAGIIFFGTDWIYCRLERNVLVMPNEFNFMYFGVLSRPLRIITWICSGIWGCLTTMFKRNLSHLCQPFSHVLLVNVTFVVNYHHLIQKLKREGAEVKLLMGTSCLPFSSTYIV